MSGNEQANDAVGARERLDDDDHDLLTFGEAGERLRIEIAAAAERVADLEAAGATDELGAAHDRLAALRSAASRNTAQPINDVNFEKFFGYPGTARRNLASRLNE
jgi:hypothetical protein